MARMIVSSLLALAVFSGCGSGEHLSAHSSNAAVRDEMATMDLSATPVSAYKMWQESRDTVHIIDVRTPAEYIWVGHPEMARNIPVKFLTRRWNADKSMPVMELNPSFIADVRKVCSPTDTIIVICHSGRRGLDALFLLRKAGWKNVLNIEGGFAGFRGKDCDCPGREPIIKPGWMEAGLPWTHELNADLMYLEEAPFRRIMIGEYP